MSAINSVISRRSRKSPAEAAAEGGAPDAAAKRSAAPYYDERYTARERERRDQREGAAGGAGRAGGAEGHPLEPDGCSSIGRPPRG